MANIGFIGLGNMGLPMAINLVKAGHAVTGFDLSSVAKEAAQDAGLSIANEMIAVTKDAEIVVSMLPNGAIAKSVVQEILPEMVNGSLLIDCSTIDVSSAREIHEMAEKSNKLCLDAPVSGGVGGATAGTLTFMVGGSDEAFAKASNALDIMGQKAVHCGDGGSGQGAKICNNMLLGISMIGAGEAFALAEKLGLDRGKLFDVISTSSGSCWSVNTYCPVPDVGPKSPADNNYEPGFAASLMLKDLGLAMEAARDAGASTPLGKHATDIYNQMSELDHGDKDFSAVINLLSKLD
ncbi:3-hydroxyisobutyrate dehydrogenase [Lentilitoribacter sp. Alg239-R112]|jgi:3-hydroxyisobutyrate dehydrogenase|uniref:3-hydroxyisobutyrate dehydrogenase n=1 Tax=Lentilitoribacter sp. Alg239-R112 TaxID=2305987 RepID=UPI0013A701E3|nr:3-hydroxyisobutyrate dehydrogenase [Lentilitoribacter sp. Alg239-R112]